MEAPTQTQIINDIRKNGPTSARRARSGYIRRCHKNDLYQCVACRKFVKRVDFKDDCSWKEYNISQLCQKCQDGIFKDSD